MKDIGYLETLLGNSEPLNFELIILDQFQPTGFWSFLCLQNFLRDLKFWDLWWENDIDIVNIVS